MLLFYLVFLFVFLKKPRILVHKVLEYYQKSICNFCHEVGGIGPN